MLTPHWNNVQKWLIVPVQRTNIGIGNKERFFYNCSSSNESSSRFSHIEGREEDDLRLEGVILGRHVILAPWQNSDTHSHRDRRTQYFLLLRFAHFEIFPRINFECTAQHLKLYTPGHCENSRCSTFSFKQFCEVYDNKISTFLCPLYFIWLLDSSNWLFPRTF